MTQMEYSEEALGQFLSAHTLERMTGVAHELLLIVQPYTQITDFSHDYCFCFFCFIGHVIVSNGIILGITCEKKKPFRHVLHI